MVAMYATHRNGIGAWIHELIRQGWTGGTVWTPVVGRPRGRKVAVPEAGYVVGGGVRPEYINIEEGTGELYATINCMLADAALQGTPIDGVGFWTDGEGRIVLDVVQWVEHFPNAVALGLNRGEEEIYGIAQGKCYVVDEWAHVPNVTTYAG